jgi:hypothetical protein
LRICVGVVLDRVQPLGQLGGNAAFDSCAKRSICRRWWPA